MLGERSSRDALASAGLPGPVGPSAGALFGAADTAAFFGPWEPLIHERAPGGGVLYWAWRRPLRRGLYLYLSRSVFPGVTPAQLRAFAHDDAWRVRWDRATASLGPAAPALEGEGAAGRESEVLAALVRFPAPMAPRAYTYARRVWPRACDGGCYALARACAPPGGAAAAPTRAVPVTDYCSAAVIRAAAGAGAAAAAAAAAAANGGEGGGAAAEMILVYFEDSLARTSIVNLGVRKGLWPAMLRTERALRAHAAGSCGDGGVGGGGFGSFSLRRAGSERWEPRGAPAAAAGVAAGARLGGALRAAARALSALGAAAGALWAAHARVASLLPRLELRLLRSLVNLIAGGLGT
ncbi:hypothetical protein MNEG_1078 [Monoraphidium neglectum]|uniref:START domain-containing protein n=1 Tax=Monoraphidium neglectum TaxID=145388 RepID=A0A0D2N3A0_9CHLO|nr:hypothetical protein MNEG_1078 [Monoraphidium neglectum]KIZ06867.1 hypothetical protein MNEG_1078 [Monoraphidium neglectum]|eukprot:XP_013905886.1 hypothetical protein MNEG_1078 [Monoraphidium neglectum]